MSIEFAKDERPDSKRIARANQFLIGEHDKRISALDHPQGLDEPVDELRAPAARDKMKDRFRVGCRLIDRTALHEIAAQRQPIGEIAIMRDREAARTQLGEKRLDIAQDRLAGRRIAHMADGGFTRQALDRRGLGEMIADETEPAFGIISVAVEGDDACRLLAAMLQGMQPKRRDGGGGGMAENSKNPAFFAQAVGVEVKIEAARTGIRPSKGPGPNIKTLSGVLRYTHRQPLQSFMHDPRKQAENVTIAITRPEYNAVSSVNMVPHGEPFHARP